MKIYEVEYKSECGGLERSVVISKDANSARNLLEYDDVDDNELIFIELGDAYPKTTYRTNPRLICMQHFEDASQQSFKELRRSEQPQVNNAKTTWMGS